MAFYQDNLGKPAPESQKGKPFSILLEQEMIGWQWRQLHQMQIICTSLQTDNHAIISPAASVYLLLCILILVETFVY